MDKLFSALASRVSAFTGQPAAFVIAVAAILVWAVTGPLFHFSDTWQLAVNTSTTIITFLMVFIIQNSQNRDGAALQAKLDELIRALDTARNEFIGVEHLSPVELQKILTAIEEEVKGGAGRTGGRASLERLLRRI
jgi:low affinity Fe/Cu permease